VALGIISWIFTTEFTKKKVKLQNAIVVLPLLVGLLTTASIADTATVGFQSLDNLYEPSGAVQLSDGRILVVEDEAERPFSLLIADKKNGTQQFATLRLQSLVASSATTINDLEAITLAPMGAVYAITSHSRNNNGKRNRTREKLVRFVVKGNRLSETTIRQDLRRSLTSAFPMLVDAAKERKLKKGDGFNIEGLAFDAQGKMLWIGFREPVIDGKAVLIAMSNPQLALENKREFQFAKQPVLLDLDRGGIRDIVYDLHLRGYLIVSQREGSKKKRRFKLWFWNGNPAIQPKRVRIAGVKSLKQTEAVVPTFIDGKSKLLFLSDDGDRIKRKAAHYLWIDYSLISIDKSR